MQGGGGNGCDGLLGLAVGWQSGGCNGCEGLLGLTV